MAFTDNCSLFGSVDEEGINRVVRHVMRQRPSLFNYGTSLFLTRPDLLCHRIDAAPDVSKRGNPLFTVEDPLPIFGTDNKFGVHFCFQLTKAEIDFHPGSVFALPPQLNPPLKAQRFAIHVQVCGGLGCPSREFVDKFHVPLPAGGGGVTVAGDPLGKEHRPPERKEQPHLPPVPVPTDKLDCFCVDLFVVAHAEIEGPKGGRQFLTGKLDGLEIVDIKPDGLENSLECYLKMLVQLVILPRARFALEKIIFEILDGLAKITLFATPISAKVPFNPAIEDNKAKVFINMEVS